MTIKEILLAIAGLAIGIGIMLVANRFKKPVVNTVTEIRTEVRYVDTCLVPDIDSMKIYREVRRGIIKGSVKKQKKIKPAEIKVDTVQKRKIFNFEYQDSLLNILEEVHVMNNEVIEFNREIYMDTPYVEIIKLVSIPGITVIEKETIKEVEKLRNIFYGGFHARYPWDYGPNAGIKLKNDLMFGAGYDIRNKEFETQVLIPLIKFK